MKKNIFITLLLVVHHMLLGQQQKKSTSVFDDVESENTSYSLTWGIRAGANLHQLYGKDIDYIFDGSNSKLQTGFNVGVFVNTRVGNQWSINHELQLSHRKMGVSLNDEVNGSYDSSLRLYYIDLLPANVTYQYKNLQVYAGPYISTLLSASLSRKDENGKKYSDKSIFGNAENNENENKYLQKFDFGFNAGLDYQLNKKWGLGLRYTNGLTDLFQYASSKDKEDSKGKIKVFNRGFNLSMRYNFKH